MDKLKMQTENIVDENVAFIEQRFPNCVVEAKDENGKVSKMVDFDLLKQELSKVVVDGDKERYQMTWPDKKQAILTANSPIAKTLRPCKEKSVDFDNTKNIYIEGDNLDVLKLLRETYLGKVKMIYIDPPYNTGNDFVYNDDFATDTDDYLQRSNQVDEEGNRMVANNESNGRFHTDWLNMMYPRLKVAKDLLTDDGAIFISIDDNEINDLTKITSEIFGDANWKATFCWRKTHTQTNIGDFARVKEYILCFAKNINLCKFNKIALTNLEEYRYVDENGEKFRRINLIDSTRGRYDYSIVNPNGNIVTGKWMKPKSDVEIMIKNGEVYWAGETPYGKNYLKKMLDKGQIANDFLGIEFGTNQRSTMHLDKMMGDTRVFDFSKPIELLQHFTVLNSDKNSIVMDFFSGSATTAHAVMQLNAEDGGNRKYIMVQLPEITDENSEAYKAGYKNICEIGEERIRRAGKKIIEENKNLAQKLDTGFRVFKLDSSNMKDTYYKPSEYSFGLLDALDENIKPDRTPEDLLFQVMLDLGLMLDSKIEEKNINGKKVFVVGEYNEMVKPDLICCFDSNVDNNTVTEIAKMQPRFAVFRDSSMAKDSVAVNFDQIFETYSPSTTRKVL